MTKHFKITLFFVVYATALLAQLQVKNFFSLTGKKNVPVNVMLQDNNGYLWLGTAEGLYKFDGKAATALGSDHPALKQNITALFIDEKETAWIGTKSGMVYLLTKNRLDSLNFTKANSEKITSFIELAGSVWIGTYGSGIYACNISNRQLSHYGSENGLCDNVIYKITGNKKNTLWCGTDAGITEIELAAGQPKFTIISNKNGLPDNIVRDLVAYDDKVLITMQDSGLCYYNLASRRIERNSFFTDWTLGAIVNASMPAPNKLVVATEKNGLLVFERGGVTTYNYEKNVQATSINQMVIDREKQIWIASKNGISQLTGKRYSFINSSKGLGSDEVLAVAIDNDNDMWIGTTMGICSIMSDGEGKLMVNKLQDLKKYTISCATRAPDGNIWFGTYGSGIIVLSSETNNSVILNSADEKLADDNISNIYFADDNTVYISTLGGGLIKAKVQLDGKYKIFDIEKTYTEAEGLGSNYVYAALTNNKGQLFVATDGGGLQTLEGDKFIDLTKRFKLSSNTVFSICKDQYNTIWATSNADGILKYNGQTMQHLRMADGLRDEQPQQLVSNDNLIYAINSKGIDKINCKTNEVSYYDLFDGDLEPNLNAVFMSGNTIYSGTNNGLLIYRTYQESVDSIRPKVFIKSFQLNYKPFPLDSIYEFKYDQNNFSFTFGGIWLKNPDKLTFRYRLHGLQGENWTYASEGKTVSYNNLNPGNYTFVVQVKNEEDVWSEPTGFSLIIQTPIWKRWWFWLITLGLVTLGVYMLIQYRLKALQRENLLLERRVKERTHQIERQTEIIESKNRELEQLSLVASKTDNVVLILDATGHLEYVNESFTKLHKLSCDEVKEKYGHTIFELSNNPNIKNIVNDAVTNRRSVTYESLNRKIDKGSEIWESSTLTPLFDDNGELKKIIIIDTDVSERKKQEQIIFQKNKDITDSISYARKIQHAILPDDALIKHYLPNAFVLYMTKDIVSGDFYWFTHIDGCSIIAAVDCTGHGVPGAFMSLIGYNLLNKIVNEQKITDPNTVLLELNKGVLEALYKNESESKDGMDIAICRIDHHNGRLCYAGAMRPLWIINNKELREIKADKIPIGTSPKDRKEPIAYTNHTISVQPGDRFYIFTDGYADQFGGPNDKKYSSSKFKNLLINNSDLGFDVQEENARREHLQWKGQNEQVDDILLIGFSI